MRLFLMAGMALALSACMHVELKEKDFLMPDRPVTNVNLPQFAPAYRSEELAIVATDNTQLKAQLLLRGDAQAVVLYFGGNQFRVHQSGRSVAETYTRFPVNLVMVDHRGYGSSEGEPTLAKLRDDGATVFDAVRKRFGSLPIIVHGHSLGSFTAAAVSDARPVQGLILEGSATTASEWADVQTPWYAPFIRFQIEDSLHQFDNRRSVAQLRAPLMILVGENDNTTPPSLSKSLYAAATQTPYRDLVIAEGKGHGGALHADLFRQRFPLLLQALTPGS